MKIRPGVEELAWVAGLLEGEGHFCYARGGAGGSTPRVQLRMADEDVVTRAAEILSKIAGKPIIIRERVTAKAGWSPLYDFVLCGESARIVMRKLLRFMSEHRRNQIISALHNKRLISEIDLEALGLSASSSTTTADLEREPVT